MPEAKTLNEEDRVLLAGAEDTPVGRAILKALALQEAHVEKQLEDPRLNTERIREDFRHVMGELRGVRFLKRLVNDERRKAGIEV